MNVAGEMRTDSASMQTSEAEPFVHTVQAAQGAQGDNELFATKQKSGNIFVPYCSRFFTNK